MAAEVDTSELDRYMTRLVAGLSSRGPAVAARTADNVAGRIRSTVPRRTGRLAGSVGTQREPGGSAVTYGTGVPYAGYIEKRAGAVADAVSGADIMFAVECEAMARTEARP